MLREAGTVLVGKTFTVEFASGNVTNPQYREELCTNPWGLDKEGKRFEPGNSSAGSGTAVASGQVFGATGTPAAIILERLSILEPMASMASGGGPIQIRPSART